MQFYLLLEPNSATLFLHAPPPPSSLAPTATPAPAATLPSRAMASHLLLSASSSSSGSSASGVPSPAPAAASLQPPLPAPSPVRHPSAGRAMVEPGVAADPAWTLVVSRKEKRRPPPLPTSRTWGVRWVPPALRGVCYNCLEPDHISAFCENETRCIACGGYGHQSRACKSPRSAAGAPHPPSRVPVWQRISHAAPVDAQDPHRSRSSPGETDEGGGARSSPDDPRSWRDVVRQGPLPSTAASFAAPFDPVAEAPSSAVAAPTVGIWVWALVHGPIQILKFSWPIHV
jgi:hypothetical protein